MANLATSTTTHGKLGTWFAGRSVHADVMVLGSFADLDDGRRAAIRHALLGNVASPAAEPRSQDRRIMRWVVCLVRPPSLIVTRGFGPVTLVSSVYRLVSRRVTLLVFLAEPPGRPWLLKRLVLKLADGVLVDGDAVAQVMLGPASPARMVARINHGRSLDRFLQISPTRAPHLARRFVVVGDLTPESGAADLLSNLSTLSEACPDRRIEVAWVGQGDLAGLLAAQPVPENLFQMFLGPQDTERLAATFESAGLLVVPSLAKSLPAPVAEALAAGLLVLGSRRSPDVLHLVTDEVNGWLFDPLFPGTMLDALTRALGTDDGRLDDMRFRARASMSAQPFVTLPTRLQQNSPAGSGMRPGYQQLP